MRLGGDAGDDDAASDSDDDLTESADYYGDIVSGVCTILSGGTRLEVTTGDQKRSQFHIESDSAVSNRMTWCPQRSSVKIVICASEWVEQRTHTSHTHISQGTLRDN